MFKTLRLISLKLIFGTLLMVSSCGPIYDTSYSYTPPANPQSAYCTNTCLNGKSYCESNCQQLTQQCEERDNYEAEREYHEYEHARRANGQPVKKSKSDFKHYCSSVDDNQCKESCTQNYNLCFSNCGGAVQTFQKCTAFCDQAH